MLTYNEGEAMIEKESYILDEGFLGTKSLFTKQNKFSFSLFLDKNEETRKEVKRSQKLKDKLDELINRSRNKKE